MWATEVPHSQWSTFAGHPRRHQLMAEPAAVGDVVWKHTLVPNIDVPPAPPMAEPRWPTVAEDKDYPLSYHPVAIGRLLLVNNQREILALDAATGEPAWGSSAAVFRDELDGEEARSDALVGGLGTTRNTLTVARGRLYARMGSGVTSRPQQPGKAGGTNYLVCLDLESQGRLLWKTMSEDGWAFEASPLVRGDDVYVAMRQSDIRPQAYVACLDARTGQTRWRRFVCAAETPSRGIFAERTNGLLTLAGDTLYYNTNLGAVAAVSTTGRLRWLTTYPRALQGDLLTPATHWARDRTPCLADRGTLYVAPTDSPRLFALAADNGQILWQSSDELDDVIHLLGVTEECLIASGHKVYWIRTSGEEAGQLKSHWPRGHEHLGYGRGLVTTDHVWWPTREAIHVFDRATARPLSRIDLLPRGAGGGNLLSVAGQLVIAGGNYLTAFAAESLPAEAGENVVSRAIEPAHTLADRSATTPDHL